MSGALNRFRFMAYVVGVGLLLLVVAMLLKYVGDAPGMVKVVGPVHGFLYIVYLLTIADLALKARWSVKGTILVMLSGVVPVGSFFAERAVTRRVQRGQKL